MTTAVLIAEGVQCTRCGYDLRGLKENRCPECGDTFDPNEFPSARLPWLIESASAWGPYWETVRLMLLHPWTVGRLVWMPVSVNAARGERFRRATMWIAIGSICAAGTLAAWLLDHEVASVATTLLAIIPAAWPFFELSTRPGHTRGHWSRGGVQSAREFGLYHFCCAPLALMPVVPVALVGVGLFGLAIEQVLMIAALALGGVFLLWWIVQVGFHAASGRGLLGDGLRAGGVVVIEWAGIAIISALFCTIAWVVAYVGIMPWVWKH